MKKNLLLLPFLGLSLVAAAPVLAGHWPGWRGPEGTGVAHETNLPLRWSRTENVRWRAALPEAGNSTPIVWGDRVFVTQAVAKEGLRTVMCFHRVNGMKLWQRGPAAVTNEPTHGTNPYCSESPVTDGERVIAAFATGGVYCYDFAGKELWRRELGRQRHIWGSGASPMLHGDLCVLNFGPGERTFLLALNKRTGETVWQKNEPGGDSGETKTPEAKAQWIGSWSTPIVATVNGREELIHCWPGRVVGFEPKTGRELWTSGGLNPLVYTSPLFADGTVIAMGGYSGMTVAVRAGGSGDVTATHRLWHHPKTKQRIGSGVIADGHIYILNDPGVAECFELRTGNKQWEERLKGPGPKSDNWSSMVRAGDRLYAVNQGGDAFVLQAGPRFQPLATNSLGETTIASMAMSDGEIFIRTHQNLWCIGTKK